MQINVRFKPATKHSDHHEKRLLKRWWIFYVFVTVMAVSTIFLGLLFFSFSPEITVLDVILFICITAILLAVFLQVKANFAVEVFEWGVLNQHMGKCTKIYWNEIRNVTYGTAINLNAGKKNIRVNPSIFQNSKEVYVFIESKLAHLRA